MIHSRMICKILAFAYVSRMSAETEDARESWNLEMHLKGLTRTEPLEKFHVSRVLKPGHAARRTVRIWKKQKHLEDFLPVWCLSICILRCDQQTKYWDTGGEQKVGFVAVLIQEQGSTHHLRNDLLTIFPRAVPKQCEKCVPSLVSRGA